MSGSAATTATADACGGGTRGIRQLFDGTGASNGLTTYAGMPQTHKNMAFVIFRYYPF